MIGNTRYLEKSIFSPTLRGGLFVSGVIATLAFASCGKEKDTGDNDQDRGPSIEQPRSLPPSFSGPNPNAPQQKLEGVWRFAGFECVLGELTPWAKLENKLVSPAGWATSNFQWIQGNSGSNDQGVIKRSHVWTITGKTATKVSKLEFISSQNAAVGSQASAWASTTKHHTFGHSKSGQLIIEHGNLEGPFFGGLPLTPILQMIGQAVEQEVSKGGVSAALLSPIRSLQDFLARTMSQNWIQGIFSFTNSLSEATETVTYNLSSSDMTLTEASVAIRGFNFEPGLAVVDVTACGLNGKALRRYVR